MVQPFQASGLEGWLKGGLLTLRQHIITYHENASGVGDIWPSDVLLDLTLTETLPLSCGIGPGMGGAGFVADGSIASGVPGE